MTDKEAELEKQKKALPLEEFAGRNFSHWITHTRHLLRERFVVLKEVKKQPWHQGQGSGPTIPRWEITDKGRLVLNLVRLEIQDQQTLLPNGIKQVKQLAKGVGK